MPRRALYRFLQSQLRESRQLLLCVNAPEGFVSISTVPLFTKHGISMLLGTVFRTIILSKYTQNAFFILLKVWPYFIYTLFIFPKKAQTSPIVSWRLSSGRLRFFSSFVIRQNPAFPRQVPVDSTGSSWFPPLSKPKRPNPFQI